MAAWDEAIAALDAHFADPQQTIDGRPLGPFAPLPQATMDSITFVDGGNAPLFVAPSACVQLVRIAALTYAGSERRNTQRIETLCIITRDKDGIGVRWTDERLPAMTLRHSESIENAADIARRVAERSVGSWQQGLVCFDGDLQPHHPLEKELIAGIARCCALAKTTTTLTDQGKSITAALVRAGPASAWLAGTGDHTVVKLHAKSDRAFLLSCHGISAHEAAACLRSTVDAAFLGYPAGLVEADRLARVGASEQQMLAELLRTRLAGRHSAELAALDAHDVLDSVAGMKTPNWW